jgi:signal peptidase I
MKKFLFGLLFALNCCTATFATTNYYGPAWQDAPPVPATAEAISIAKALAVTVNGKAALIRATNSMLPTLTAKDIVVYKPISFDEIKVADIIIFEVGEKPSNDCLTCTFNIYAHRVVEKGKRSVRTKGDNNTDRDNFETPHGKIKGVIVEIVDGQTGVVRDLQVKQGL